jgi:hypothetical protein
MRLNDIMKANEGKLQTAEHILARTIERGFSNSRFIISTFKEATGKIEVYTETDLRTIDLAKLQNDVNSIIHKNLQVKKYIIKRKGAETEFDLTRLPSSVKEIRIVEIEGFDKTLKRLKINPNPNPLILLIPLPSYFYSSSFFLLTTNIFHISHISKNKKENKKGALRIQTLLITFSESAYYTEQKVSSWNLFHVRFIVVSKLLDSIFICFD